MATHKLINFEDIFNKLERTPLIVNEHSSDTDEDKQLFNDKLLTVYQSDTLQPAPQCSCGVLKGRFRLGQVCDSCGDSVTEVFQTTIEPLMWLIPLPGIKKYISPIVYRLMSRAMKLGGGLDTLQYMTDPLYRPHLKKGLPDKLSRLYTELGHERGLNYFYENFDKIMSDYIGTGNKIPKKLEELMEFISYNRDAIFTDKIPIPSKVMFPIEVAGKSNYGDKHMVDAINAVRIIQEGVSKQHTQSIKQQESRSIKAIELLATYHYNYFKETIGKKEGVVRQHIFGGRWHFSSRAVIVSISEPHDFRELHLPWAIAMEQFSLLVINKLIKRKHTLSEINNMMRTYATEYSPYIDEIFKELIAESKYIGLPGIFQRNPTIRRASAILVFVTKVKTDADDFTIGASVGYLTGMNADLDGDALHFAYIPDEYSYEMLEPLSLYNNVMDLSSPWKISSNLKIHPPAIATVANWLQHGRKAAYGE